MYIKGRLVNCDEYEFIGWFFFDIGNIIVLIDEGFVFVSEIFVGVI